MKNLVTVRTYADMKGVTTMCVYKWEKQGKISITEIDGVKFVELSAEEMQQRESLFSKHPTKGLHRIGDVMSAMFNGKVEE